MNKRHNKWKICGAGMLLGLFLGAGIGTAYAHHVIVDTDYVLKNKDKPGVVLVDARAASDYKKGLIPGAVVLGEKGGAGGQPPAAERATQAPGGAVHRQGARGRAGDDRLRQEKPAEQGNPVHRYA